MTCLIFLAVLCAAIGLSEVNAMFFAYLSLDNFVQKFNLNPFLQQGLTKAEVDQMFTEFLFECAKKEGGTDDDIKFIRDRNIPVRREQDCIVSCVGENFDLVSSGSADSNNDKFMIQISLKFHFHCVTDRQRQNSG